MQEINLIKKELEDLKVENLKLYNFNHTSPFYDYFLIATVNKRQAEACITHLKKVVDIKSVEGKQSGWVVIDLGDIVVHLFDSETRKFYDLDKILFGFLEE